MKIFASDLKYLAAYTIPLMALSAIFYQEIYSYVVPFVAFGLIPLMELFLPASDKNFDEPTENKRIHIHFFDFLLYLNVPLLYTILFFYFRFLSASPAINPEFIGITFTVGICCGVMGINVAHELGHRSSAFERILAKSLLVTSMYLHFIIEHNRGHHRNVSTPLDPASADFNESLYKFWFRSITGSILSAWHLEKIKLERAEKPIWSYHNEMLQFAVLQLLYFGVIGGVFGISALAGAVVVAFIGILLLETVNYVEHYGLRRKEIEPGIYEKVKPTHSWNSDHALGRILLYELTRHSDHHYKAQRPYQILRHFHQSPQLPTGYPGCMLLALIPPVWFRVMNPRIESINQA